MIRGWEGWVTYHCEYQVVSLVKIHQRVYSSGERGNAYWDILYTLSTQFALKDGVIFFLGYLSCCDLGTLLKKCRVMFWAYVQIWTYFWCRLWKFCLTFGGVAFCLFVSLSFQEDQNEKWFATSGAWNLFNALLIFHNTVPWISYEIETNIFPCTVIEINWKREKKL